MKLNADVGEGTDNDESLFQWIDMANVACGAHAGGDEEMSRAVELAVSYGVAVGAHPGYPDRDNFGRRSMDLSTGEIVDLIIEQVEVLDKVCQIFGVRVDYIKPHGALYHDMMNRREVYEAILKATAQMSHSRALMIMARKDDQSDRELAMKYGVALLFEAFADRAYTAHGTLMERSEQGAVFSDTGAMVEQVLELKRQGYITSSCGEKITMTADSICVHGDNQAAVEAAKQVHIALRL
ncbi:MAG: 5-oxoprolinase subunit PxpA [Akkermansiaceae bacterium]|nr:5-oxoprolinase subunit PxpA [Akkermansiaceae bacterium]